ncbi:BTAD domain-containing putative transcriptional regulator [Micrococcus luteus]|uniref:BTAD domain-containing putative transcriptional regulator n=1 Tax=Micrococcus luteus TaxID=1270 RepID=UPI00044584D3|nr:BTAD domain-containing putative transcriptional regulator [Micrococcus luteus]EZP59443.1 putative membrane protein [Micrococcus luteus]MCV7543151.1 hypothetical protein [Micrococcus luteus]
MRTLKGLGALLVLLLLMVGIPAALILFAGNPIPTMSELQQALTGVDFGGTFLLGTILPLIGWGFWASFVFSVLVEARAALNNVTAPQLAGLRPQQALAGALVAAVLAIGAGTPAAAMTAQPSTNGSSISTQLEDTPTQPTDQADARQYTIQTGDTLWGVAEQKLGDGSRWSELAEGLKNRPQADGTTMSDPNLIYAGWTVELPGDQTASSGQRTAPTDQATDQPDVAPEAPASDSAPATEQAPASEQAPATPPASVPGEVVPQSEREQSPAPDQEASPVPGAAFAVAPDQPASDRAEAETAQPEQVEWSTLGGIGAFAAAGLLGVLGARRAMQRRRRRPGQQVPMPEAEHAQIEAQLKVVAEAEQADELDVVQRWLARWAQQSGTTLPELFLVRVSAQEIALYLMGPAQLPAPFVAAAEDGTVWTLQSGAIELDADLPSAPWPGLVTVGQDDTDAQVLLDLERLGTLGIEGDPQLAPQVLDAMAVELATAAWSENVQVTLVGVAPGLASVVGGDRVRQIDDLDHLIRLLQGKAEDTRAALTEQGAANLDEAKSMSAEGDWAPEIVLLGLHPDQDQARQINELAAAIPHLGIAAVTTSNPLDAQWVLTLEDERNADLQPTGQHLRPQLVTPEETEQITQVLATALQQPQDTGKTSTRIDPAEVLNPSKHLTAVPDPHEPAADQDEERTEQIPQVSISAAEERTLDQYLIPAEQTEDAQDPAGELGDTPTQDPAELGDTPAEQAPTEGAVEPEDVEEQTPGETAPQLETTAEQPAQDELGDTPAEQAPTEGAVEPEDDAAPDAAGHQQEPEQATRESAEEDAQDQAPAGQPDTADQEQHAPAATVSQLSAQSPKDDLERDAAQMLEQKHSGAPMIRLLGEMKVIGARGTAPISASNGKVSQAQEARCVALAAFLSLHPGATAEQVHAAFWPNARPEGSAASSNRNKLATHTRRLLGQAEDGTVYFPAVTTTEGYRLDESVLTDWQVFQELVGPDPVTASTPSLLAAMQLVRGEPFAHAKPRNIAWADELVQQMTQRICDAAHELVARSLASGNTEHARLAARAARAVDPANEAAWRDAMLAEAAAGRRDEVARLVEGLHAYLEDFEDGLEPEEETAELIEQLRNHGYRVAS